MFLDLTYPTLYALISRWWLFIYRSVETQSPPNHSGVLMSEYSYRWTGVFGKKILQFLSVLGRGWFVGCSSRIFFFQFVLSVADRWVSLMKLMFRYYWPNRANVPYGLINYLLCKASIDWTGSISSIWNANIRSHETQSASSKYSEVHSVREHETPICDTLQTQFGDRTLPCVKSIVKRCLIVIFSFFANLSPIT